MKIVILGTAYPYRGGLAAFNERLAKEFEHEGHQVKIHNFRLQYPNLMFPGKSQFDPEKRVLALDNERSVSSIDPLNWWRVGKKIAKEKPDLIIVKFWLPFMGTAFGTILRRVKKNKHTKVISILDNVIPHKPRPGDRLLTRYFSKSVDGFVSMSKSVLEDLNKFDKKKPRMLSPHPIFDNFGKKLSRDEALNHLKLDSSYKYVLFFGLIRDYKGLDLIIQAFTYIRKEQPRLRLLIAGEIYSNKKKYFDLIERLNLKEQVVFHHRFIADSEVKYYFSACELVAQPYKTATQSGVTQIAYHFEKPMNVTDVGGLKEMCPDGKVGYVTPVDVKAIADAILRYFSREGAEEEMTTYIRQQKKAYSWETLVQNIFLLLDKINFK